MQKLNDKQALELIKMTLDKATKAGLFENINDIYTIVMAFDVIAKKIIPENEVDAN